jgi:acetylornithine deacetylase/succinyl-diaminopimelate desuccinylase-like protein
MAITMCSRPIRSGFGTRLPFEPVLKNGYVFARGATDNKGQILSHILGVQEQLEANRDLPVNLHFVIEGEEEIGSANLGNFLSQNRDALKPESWSFSDTGMVAPGRSNHELRACAGSRRWN